MTTNKKAITGNIDYTAASQTMTPSNLSSGGKMPSASPVGEAIGEVVRGAATFIPLAMKAAEDNEYNRLYNELDAALLANTTKGFNNTQNRIFIQKWKKQKIASNARLSSINKAVKNRPVVPTKTNIRNNMRIVSHATTGEILNRTPVGDGNPAFAALNKSVSDMSLTSRSAPQFVKAAGGIQKGLEETFGEGHEASNLFLNKVNSNVADVHNLISNISANAAMDIENIEDIKYNLDQNTTSIQNALNAVENVFISPLMAGALDEGSVTKQQALLTFNAALTSFGNRFQDPTLQNQGMPIGKMLTESRNRMAEVFEGMSASTNKDVVSRLKNVADIANLKRSIEVNNFIDGLRDSSNPQERFMYKTILQDKSGFYKGVSTIIETFNIVGTPAYARAMLAQMMAPGYKDLVISNVTNLEELTKQMPTLTAGPAPAFNVFEKAIQMPLPLFSPQMGVRILNAGEAFLKSLQIQNQDGELVPRHETYTDLVDTVKQRIGEYKIKLQKLKGLQ